MPERIDCEPETGTTERDVNAHGNMQQVAQPVALPAQRVKRFPVIEIFGPVIQGEGSQAGQQTMFIRFGGCDYRCTKCDSLHAVIPEAISKHATYMSAEEIMDKMWCAREETGVQWVTFTGGNPAMHKLDELVDMLNAEGWLINVETQGTLWQEWIAKCTLITISPKSFGMGEKFEEEKFHDFLENIPIGLPVCIKVVVFAEIDLEVAQRIQAVAQTVIPKDHPSCVYYLSVGNPFPPTLNKQFDLDPITWEKSYTGFDLTRELLKSYRRLSEEVLQDRRMKSWRFLPQLHVLMYGNEAER